MSELWMGLCLQLMQGHNYDFKGIFLIIHIGGQLLLVETFRVIVVTVVNSRCFASGSLVYLGYIEAHEFSSSIFQTSAVMRNKPSPGEFVKIIA